MTNVLLDYQDTLYDCLLTAIANYAAANPSWIQPKQVCVFAGDVVVEDLGASDDYCCASSDGTQMGTAYVRLLTLFPSSIDPFPAQDSVATNCGPLAWNARFEVGFMRCAPAGDINPVTCAQWNTTASLMADDALVMTQALCCFRQSLGTTWMSLIGSYDPIGPTGGCIRAAIPIDAEIQMCFDC